MSETLFSLWFAVMGMLAVFSVITVLTLAMVLSGSIFAGRRRNGPDSAPEPRRATSDGDVPPEHVAVIAATLAIHGADLEEDVVLIGGQDGSSWSGDGRRRVPPGQVPTLRRTR